MVFIKVNDGEVFVECYGSKIDVLTDLTKGVGSFLANEHFNERDVQTVLKTIPKAIQLHNNRK